MFPGVDAEQWNKRAGHWVLVCTRDQNQVSCSFILGQPSPATALDTGECGIEILDKRLNGTKVLLDGGLRDTLAES